MYPTTITHITFIYSQLGVSPKRLNDYVLPTGSVGSVAVGGKSGAGLLCVGAVFAETGMEVFFVHQDNFTLPPTFERQTVRSRLECVARCCKNSTCSLALHGDLSLPQRECLHVHGVLTLKVGTILMQSFTVMPDVWAVVRIQPWSIEWGLPNNTTPKQPNRKDKK
ncbi:uncharacterized protein LOC127865572 isoform X1 [Dreissena polymorpha]|nr:uncharacterized protein LOC127865572 isoform X1 [Dreissena polymorpha]